MSRGIVGMTSDRFNFCSDRIGHTGLRGTLLMDTFVVIVNHLNLSFNFGQSQKKLLDSYHFTVGCLAGCLNDRSQEKLVNTSLS